MEFEITDGKDKTFIKLCGELDDYLYQVIGGQHQKAKYDKYNTLEEIHDVVIVLVDGKPAGCGSFKEYASDTVELKRIFVKEEYRKHGIAHRILRQLEKTAKEQGYQRLILETGKPLVQAVHLYEKSGFRLISNYGQYKNMTGSICMEKQI